MSRRVASISDVAKRAGVSKTTVSMVLRDKPGISEATRERVLRASRELRYRPSPTRQTRGKVQSGQIGFLVSSDLPPRMGNEPGGSYLHQMTLGAMTCASQAGYSLSLSHVTTDEFRQGVLPPAISRQPVDGLLVRSLTRSRELIQLIQAAGLPTVPVDCDTIVHNASQVQIDNMLGMRQLIDHLVEQGHRSFAVITGDMDHLNAQERLAGLQAAVAAHGIFLPETAIVRERDFDEISGERGAQTLLSRGYTFDALICQNDLIALGAMKTLQKHDYQVPDDVCVAGFDNMMFSAHLATGLTSLDSRPFALGETAARLLIDQLRDDDDASHLQVRVPPALQVRASSQRRALANA